LLFCFFKSKQRLVILSEAKDLLLVGTEKQVLRAFGAQDDMLSRFLLGRKERV